MIKKILFITKELLFCSQGVKNSHDGPFLTKISFQTRKIPGQSTETKINMSRNCNSNSLKGN